VPDSIPLRGVRTHNLRSIDVEIPLGRITAVSGVSGAGKTSLALDTLYAESQRRYLQSFSVWTRQFLERFDQPDADHIGELPPAIALDRRHRPVGPRATVGSLTEILEYLRLLLARVGGIVCTRCGHDVRAQRTEDVVRFVESLGVGTRISIGFLSQPDDGEDIAAWAKRLLEDGFVRIHMGGTVHGISDLASHPRQSPPLTGSDTGPVVLLDRLEVGKMAPQRLFDSLETAFRRGQDRLIVLTEGNAHPFDRRLVCPRCDIRYAALEPRLLDANDPLGACPRCHGAGVEPKTQMPCSACDGRRWNEQALSVRWRGKTIADLATMPLAELEAFLASGAGEPRDGASDAASAGATPRTRQDAILVEQIRKRLAYLLAVELGYLTLLRSAASLSNGEAQRVQLTTALGANLVGVLYVFEEPSSGLHVRDRQQLWRQLQALRDAGNTLVLVEHDLAYLRGADHLVDLGPGAGEEGGRVVFQGSPALLDAETQSGGESITAEYLRGTRFLDVPASRRRSEGAIRLSAGTMHNLHDVDVSFPLGVLCAVSGVSGAGKTTLVQRLLYPALAQRLGKKGFDKSAVPCTLRDAGLVEDVVLMDQEALPRSARSNPATYLKVFDDIRAVFADTTEAKIRNYDAGRFSFNQPGGRCETCQGQGTLTVDMQFLADVTMTCPECLGSRFEKELLAIKVRGLSIAEVLNLTVREAFRFFRTQRSIEKRLKWLLDVGLDYLRLGQPSETLSGGEAQRLKLAGHLASSRKPRTLFLLMEPTTGLHMDDVAGLLECLHRLIEMGHSVIAVEHHLGFIAAADHVIDMGPGAGPEGGRIVAFGTPEEVARTAGSVTGMCLKRYLE
jgi:excinuclease ABC subunit A